MIYSNDNPIAISAMELERTGNYGDENNYKTEYCPICNAGEPTYFYFNNYDECVGCSECLQQRYTLTLYDF